MSRGQCRWQVYSQNGDLEMPLPGKAVKLRPKGKELVPRQVCGECFRRRDQQRPCDGTETSLWSRTKTPSLELGAAGQVGEMGKEEPCHRRAVISHGAPRGSAVGNR